MLATPMNQRKLMQIGCLAWLGTCHHFEKHVLFPLREAGQRRQEVNAQNHAVTESQCKN